jgi:hypothetical protein
MPADEQGSRQLFRQDAEALRGPAFGDKGVFRDRLGLALRLRWNGHDYPL